VDAESLDHDKVFRASRYGKGGEGSAGDYLNCPLAREQYEEFIDAVLAAEEVARHEFESVKYFEACLPIEVLARRGRETLRFGPMKPVGLTDPRTGRRPHAVVQLRQENARASSYNLVGFQNHLKFGEQKRILRLIPGLEKAEILRYGQIHRNTYINAPALLTPTLQLHSHENILVAGQLCGTEGYVEAIATGLMAGRHAARLAQGEEPVSPPRQTALGSLVAFDLLPPLPVDEQQELRSDKKARRARQCERALAALGDWLQRDSRPAVPAD
jgi:methylenetetrahydrofolate--tRNA-(uracil-5-)-methyltransferase